MRQWRLALRLPCVTNLQQLDKLRAVNSLRRTNKASIAFFLLLVFGLQVQASFACTIADYSGPVASCCCGDEQMPDITLDDNPPCCEYSQGVVVKGSDPAQKSEALATGGSFEFKFDPPPVFFALLAIWLEPRPYSQPIASLDFVPVHALGTQTYLATQRLRI